MTELSADWVLPVDGPPIEDGLVRWEDGAIVEVGPGRAERHYADAAIVPGFVNAHSHLEYSVYAGFGDGQRVRAVDRDCTSSARAGSSATTCSRSRGAAPLDSLAAGITTTADYSFSGAAATAAAELGLRAIVYLEVFGSDPAEARAPVRARCARASSETALVRIGVSPHAPYTCSLDVYRWCLSLGIPVGTHLAESANENEWLEHGTRAARGDRRRPRRRRPASAPSRRSSRCSGPDLLCAHCVEVDDDEIALLAERDVPVAHCPRSNALLGCGIAPLAELRAAGVRVGLGTDSPASTPSFDMFEEMRGGDLRRAGPRAARRRALAADALRAGDARCGPRAADSTTRSVA